MGILQWLTLPERHKTNFAIRVYTENMVIFAGGKFRKARHFMWGYFHDTTIFFIKSCGFYFRVGVIFAKKTKGQKT